MKRIKVSDWAKYFKTKKEILSFKSCDILPHNKELSWKTGLSSSIKKWISSR